MTTLSAATRWPEPRRGDRWLGSRLGGAIGASAVVHALVIGAAIFWRGPAAPAAPPVYAVSLVAAPPGPRAIGVVDPNPPPAPRQAAPQAAAAAEVTPPTPARAETRPEAMRAPSTAKTAPKATPRATPVPSTAKKPTPPAPTPAKPTPKPTTPKATSKPEAKTSTPPRPDARPGGTGSTAPRAGGGPEGGRGTDVANVQIAGLQFPYRGYLDNIVRQVALRFSPPSRNAMLQADVAFLIHRDGTVSDVRIVKRSGNYAFDLEARGAVEATGQARAFGPLPEPFQGDVLPVTFSFDPRIIR